MSHITRIKTIITDIPALAEAAKELGLQLHQGVETYKWFGSSTGPIPEGFTVSDLGKCEHVIRLPGCEYEIGVAKLPGSKASKPAYTLLYDHWGPGQKLHTACGNNLSKLVQLYGVHAATRAARNKGYTVTRQQKGKEITLTINAY
jgi:hypothetical protein